MPNDRLRVLIMAVIWTPLAELFQKSQFIQIGLGVTRQWNVQQQIAILVDHIGQ